ncbi:putative Acid phosphatase [Helianthus annuus]|nr:putative Acid phosphatase [Helianthus annuus]
MVQLHTTEAATEHTVTASYRALTVTATVSISGYPFALEKSHTRYNSYSSHYQEFECMRLEMEQLLYQYRVDIIFSGHVSII